MRFTKMQGLGNDYVYINCFEERVDKPSELAKVVSDRHFGIGSDGLILLMHSDTCDIKMRMFNADGSEAAMCGNGLRCVAKLAYDLGVISDTRVTVETLAGNKYVQLLQNERGQVVSARARMGKPSFLKKEIPMAGAPQEPAIAERITVNGVTYEFTGVSVGNPHCVVWVTDTARFPVAEIGTLLEHNPLFSESVNVEFCQLISRKEMNMRVWERGSGETLACGTGASAAVAAGVESGYLDRDVSVHLLGGDLRITYQPDGELLMEGPCITVFTGEYPSKEA